MAKTKELLAARIVAVNTPFSRAIEAIAGCYKHFDLSGNVLAVQLQAVL